MGLSMLGCTATDRADAIGGDSAGSRQDSDKGDTQSIGDTQLQGGDTGDAQSDSDTRPKETVAEQQPGWIALCESQLTEEDCASASNSLPDLTADYGMFDAWHGCAWGEFTKRTMEEDGPCVEGDSMGVCYYQSGGEESPEPVHLEGCGDFEAFPTYIEEGTDIFIGYPLYQHAGEKLKKCSFDIGLSSPTACGCVCLIEPDPYLVCDADQGICTDETNGLMWPLYDTPNHSAEYSIARDRCQASSVGGYSDWRLPTILELRTLIRGCPQNETEGTCPVSETCLNTSCAESDCSYCFSGFWTGSSECPSASCINDECVTCSIFPEGPCAMCDFNYGAYLVQELNWTNTSYWSSSEVPQTPANSETRHWGVDFSYGAVILDGTYAESSAGGTADIVGGMQSVICVRNN
jgi:hypothetical protein